MSCCRHCPTIAQGMLHACPFDRYVQRRGQLWWSVSSLLAIQKCDGGKIQFYYIPVQTAHTLASSSPQNRRRQISLPCALVGTDGVGLQDLVLWGGHFLVVGLSQNSLESIIFWKICYFNGIVGTLCLCSVMAPYNNDFPHCCRGHRNLLWEMFSFLLFHSWKVHCKGDKDIKDTKKLRAFPCWGNLSSPSAVPRAWKFRDV